MTCDFCVGWSPAQWELFAKKKQKQKKTTYAEGKHSRPSGSVPPAPKTSPRVRTSLEVTQPGISSSSPSLPSGGQDKRGGFRGARGVASLEAFSPPARPRSSERGGSVSGRSSAAREHSSVSSAPSGAVEGEVVRSQWTPPACAASSIASPRSSQHALRHGELGEFSVGRSRSRSSRVSQSSDRGTRKDRRARPRSDSSLDRFRRSRSRSAYRSRSRASEAGVVSIAVLPRMVAT